MCVYVLPYKVIEYLIIIIIIMYLYRFLLLSIELVKLSLIFLNSAGVIYLSIRETS